MKRALSGFVFLLSVFTLYASTFVYMDVEDITNRSDVIIRGKVREVESRYNEERTKIFTYSTIDVKDVLKGKLPPIIKVRTFGGRVEDVNMKVPGMPEFKKDEEVFLFLKKSEDFYHVTGMIQGKYTIEKDESGKEYLKNNFHGIVFKKVNAENKLEDMKPEDIPSQYEYLEFVSKIKELILKKKTYESKNR